MKLLHQTQRWFLWVAAPAFILSGFVLYAALNRVFNDAADEKMSGMQREITDYVRQHDTLPVFFQTRDKRIEIRQLPSTTQLDATFSDTLLFNEAEQEYEPFRRLSFPVGTHSRNWRVTVLESAVEHEDLATTIALLLFTLFALLFGLLLWVNRRIAQRLWQPFFATLDRLSRFRLSDPEPLRTEATRVDEFRELNAALRELTVNAQREFMGVKQFTENASHELQTPLAIIQNKIEWLFQDAGLSEPQARQLDIIRQNARRMARLNQSLLLLAKIENKQFDQRENVDLKNLLEKRLDWFGEYFAHKNLLVQPALSPATILINPFLAETLINNLCSNAFQYALPGTALHIRLEPGLLQISNRCTAPDRPVSELSARFARGSSQSGGHGLGLAIVREICDQNGLELQCSFEDGIWHTAISLSKTGTPFPPGAQDHS